MRNLTEKPSESDVVLSKGLLISMYKKHLQLDDIGADSGFYKSGGTSLTATLLLADLLSEFRVRVSFDEFDKNNTPASLTQIINNQAAAAPIPGIRRHDRFDTDVFALSAPQRSRCWYHAGFQGERAADEGVYNVPYACWITGNIDIANLEKALWLVASMHDSQGMSYSSKDGRVSQVYSPKRIVQFHAEPAPGSIVDAYRSERSSAGTLHLYDDPHVKSFIHAPFDWSRGETVRCAVYGVAEAASLLIVSWNHLSFDFISKGIFLRDLSRTYDLLCAGGSGEAAKPIQYRDYLEWQRQYRDSPAHGHDLSYWTQYLADSEQDLGLATKISRREARLQDVQYVQEKRYLDLDPSLAARVKAVSRDVGTTPYTVLLTAFAVTLAKLSGTTRLTVGTQIGNRRHTEVMETCGCFAQPIAIAANFDPDGAVESVFRAVHEDLNAAMEHQPVALPEIAEALQRRGNRRFHPLYQCVFEYFDVKPEPFALAGTTVREVFTPYHFGRTSNELALLLWEKDDRISGAILYAVELYDSGAADALADAYIRTLEAILQNTELTVRGLLSK